MSLLQEIQQYGLADCEFNRAILGKSVRQDIIQSNKPITYHRNPTKSEIKRGYGAIHYKDIPLENCLKSDLTLKKWLVCPHDGLRYYR